MGAREAPQGWSLNQGLAAQYAALAGIDPDLAAAAGEEVWDVLKALPDAIDERDPGRRSKRVALAKRRLNKAGLSRHRDLAKSIRARLASLDGVRPSVNPATGLQEFRVAGTMRGAGFEHSNPFNYIDPFAGRGMGFVSPGNVVPGGSNPSQVSVPVGGNNTAPQAGPPPQNVEIIPVTAPRPQPPAVPAFRPPPMNLQPDVGPPALPPVEDILPGEPQPYEDSNPAIINIGLDSVEELMELPERDGDRYQASMKEFTVNGSPRASLIPADLYIRNSDYIARLREVCRRKGYNC